ncbi:hypothetical protein GSY74_06765 [Sulfurovum sp. bin170]|uniref:hypothetical protein n=1 Tax=Sulfurovum sp. bin170 TaxID=2695268 RepID=UPI0013E09B8D|nr:hypothetical protein [Sulfurovum sp. bin170]NEW60983.1 hypothetical protein [Sulfurovum sp. bin170]
MNETTKNSISNAWEEYAVFDDFGRVWIISDKIHVLLRTSKENAKYIVGGDIESYYRFKCNFK